MRPHALLASILLAVPWTTNAATVVTGFGAGAVPQVGLFDSATGQPLSSFLAYDALFAGGVRVATGDVNGDGVADIVTGAGPGGGPQVKVFDGKSGAVIQSFFAFNVAFTGGVYVAAGDVNGDGHADVVVGADAGGEPQVKVFDGASGAEIRSFFAYGVNFSGGVRVAAGDVNGDGLADIVTGTGAGGGPNVKVFDGLGGAEILSFFAFDPGFTSGVFVAAGDVNDDGHADIVVGTDSGGQPQVKVFDGASGVEARSFIAYDVNFTGGVRVAAGDVNGDGVADIVTGAGTGGGPNVKVFDGVTGALVQSFLAAAPNFAGGIYVAAAGDILNPAQMLSTLIATVAGLNFQQGVKLLQGALDNFNQGNVHDACDQLSAFINKVRAQSGKSLSALEANQLLLAATDIKLALGCP